MTLSIGAGANAVRALLVALVLTGCAGKTTYSKADFTAPQSELPVTADANAWFAANPKIEETTNIGMLRAWQRAMGETTPAEGPFWNDFREITRTTVYWLRDEPRFVASSLSDKLDAIEHCSELTLYRMVTIAAAVLAEKK